MVESQSKFSYRDLIKGLKNGQYRKILVLTGSGISEPAGVPTDLTPRHREYDDMDE